MSVAHSRSHQPEPLATPVRLLGQQLLQMRLDAILLQRRGLPHVVRDVGDDLADRDVETVLGRPRALAHDHVGEDPVVALLELDDRRRGHPVLRLIAAGVGVDHHAAVRT